MNESKQIEPGQPVSAGNRSRSEVGLAPRRISLRTRLALLVGSAAAAASRLLGRGSGGMIGGTVALALAPKALRELAAGRKIVLVTGTNGKSTTTRMCVAALSHLGPVATNGLGDNMEEGIVSALMSCPQARIAVLEVDEMHLQNVASQTNPSAFILLNLSRDQLDRVGEITSVERRIRAAVEEHPQAWVVANCDDPLIVSAAWQAQHPLWVGAGGGWANDSVSFPRNGATVVRQGNHWLVPGEPKYCRPDPDWWIDDQRLCSHQGSWSLDLALPGRANLGNAAQAVAAATTLGVRPECAITAVSRVSEVAGRYSLVDFKGRLTRLLLAKNPAGWQEAMSMIDPQARQVVIAVNGQVPDGVDLSWLWDVSFESLRDLPVVPVLDGDGDSAGGSGADLIAPADSSAESGQERLIIACGERGSDLAVRLRYGGIACLHADTPLQALAWCRPGPVELLANYTAFRDLKRELDGGAKHE